MNFPGTGVNYPTGTMVVQGETLGDFVAGKRCPEIQLISTDSGASDRIYTVYPYGEFVVFLLSDTDLILPDNVREHVQRWRLTGSPTQGGEERVFTLVDNLHRGLLSEEAKGKAVVIRPDLYVGYVGDEAGVSNYLEGIFLQDAS